MCAVEGGRGRSAMVCVRVHVCDEVERRKEEVEEKRGERHTCKGGRVGCWQRAELLTFEIRLEGGIPVDTVPLAIFCPWLFS